MTKRANYEGIASALRSLHEGEETYTPGEMAEYLATQGTELKPENIAEGITIFGVTGTMKHGKYDDWPPYIPPVPEFDEVVGELDPNAPKMDKMLLMDDKGNVTVGYMYNTAVTGWYKYGGAVLPPVPEEAKSTHPYDAITVIRGGRGEVKRATLYRSASRWYYSGDESKHLNNKADAPAHVRFTYTSESGVWSEGTYSDTQLNFALEVGEKLVYLSHSSLAGITVTYPASTPSLSPFAITAYSYKTTEFRAIGWIRVAYHTTGEYAGKFTVDDFRATESGGWNYIKNVRLSTRESLEYNAVSVWPQGPETLICNGHTVAKFTYNSGTRLILKEENGYALYIVDAGMQKSGNYILLDNGAYSVTMFHLCALSGEPLLSVGAAGYPIQQMNSIYLGTDAGKLIWTNFDLPEKGDGSVFMAAGSVSEGVRQPDFV